MATLEYSVHVCVNVRNIVAALLYACLTMRLNEVSVAIVRVHYGIVKGTTWLRSVCVAERQGHSGNVVTMIKKTGNG